MRRIGIGYVFCALLVCSGGHCGDVDSLWAEAIWRSVANPDQTDLMVEGHFSDALKLAEAPAVQAKIMVSLGDCLGLHDHFQEVEGKTVEPERKLFWYRKAAATDANSVIAWYRIADLTLAGSAERKRSIANLRRLMPESALADYLSAEDVLAAKKPGPARAAVRYLAAGNEKVFRYPLAPAPADYKLLFPKESGVTGAGWGKRLMMPRHFEPILMALRDHFKDMARCRAMARELLAMTKQPGVDTARAVLVSKLLATLGLTLREIRIETCCGHLRAVRSLVWPRRNFA